MSARDLTANLDPVLQSALAPLFVVPKPVPEPEPEGCEACWEIRAHYLNKGLCNRCRRQAQRDHEAGL